MISSRVDSSGERPNANTCEPSERGAAGNAGDFGDPGALAPEPYWRTVVRALRPHQWVKNLLVFVPIMTSLRWLDVEVWTRAGVMFCAFSMTASGGYLVNDVVDVDADRRHTAKRRRPVASGRLGIAAAVVLAGILVVAGMVTAWALNRQSLVVVVVYFLMSTAYTLVLKSKLVVDVVTLALLYISRIVAGNVATGIPDSFWLFTFSGTIFLSLAFLKRYVEIVRATDPGAIPGRGYLPGDGKIIAALGVANGIVSILVLALYINSPEVHLLYHEPKVLWATLPVVLSWVAHMWIMADRGAVHDDPIVYCLKDRFTYGAALALFAIAVVAVLWKP